MQIIICSCFLSLLFVVPALAEEKLQNIKAPLLHRVDNKVGEIQLISQKSTSSPTSAQKAGETRAIAPGTTICGKASNRRIFPGVLCRVVVTDAEGKSRRLYFDCSEGDGDCDELLNEGNFICVDVEKHTENTSNMESLGVSERIITYVKNCRKQ